MSFSKLISVLCIALGVSCSCALGDESSDEHAQQLRLTFEGVFEPSDADWRTPSRQELPVLVTRAVKDDSGQVLGFLWTVDALAAEDVNQWLEEHHSILDQLGLSVARTTALRDGGIDGASRSISTEALAGFAERNGEFDLYNIEVLVGTLGSQAAGIDLITGLRAVKARVGHRRTGPDASGTVRTTLDLGQGVVAIPIVGTGVHWQPNDAVRLSGSASTHTIDEQATYYDLSAAAEIRIMPNVGLVAGYQYVRSVMEVRDVPAELNEAGLFARVRIKF